MIIGTHDQKTLDQLDFVGKSAVATALMADGHLGYVMPIGGVAAYDGKVSPMGVGFDIACGNCAVLTDITFDQIKDDIPKIADEIEAQISFGIGLTNQAQDAPTDHELFDSEIWKIFDKDNQQKLRAIARNQLGTVGGGNHYVDVFKDSYDRIWVGVHFGSRGLGHKIASGFMNLVQDLPFGSHKFKEEEHLLDLDSSIGSDYWEAMELAGAYAYAGRDWVTNKVAKGILGGRELDRIHNHHNFAWKEVHTIDGDRREVVVIRKGATPAFAGQRGFVGGSMGDNSVILSGSQPSVGGEMQEKTLFSTVHGAGRVMGRSMAKGARHWKTGKLKLDETGNPKRAPLVTREMMDEWVARAGVELRGGGVDESPHVYRRLDDVLEQQGRTIIVNETLTPIIVVMAPANEYDPYKD